MALNLANANRLVASSGDLALLPPSAPSPAATFNTCLAAVAMGTDSIPAHQHATVASRALQVGGQ